MHHCPRPLRERAGVMNTTFSVFSALLYSPPPGDKVAVKTLLFALPYTVENLTWARLLVCVWGGGGSSGFKMSDAWDSQGIVISVL